MSVNQKTPNFVAVPILYSNFKFKKNHFRRSRKNTKLLLCYVFYLHLGIHDGVQLYGIVASHRDIVKVEILVRNRIFGKNPNFD